MAIGCCKGLRVAIAGALIASCTAAAVAQTPAPTASPTASPTAPPSPVAPPPPEAPRVLGLQLTSTFTTTFLSHNTSSPGQLGPEAPAYLNGALLAPNTPYDTFSSAPLTPGVAGIADAFITPTERTK